MIVKASNLKSIMSKVKLTLRDLLMTKTIALPSVLIINTAEVMGVNLTV